MPPSKAGERLRALRAARSRTSAGPLGAGLVQESNALADDVSQLTEFRPAWDEPMRIRGAIRRLENDSSDQGWRQAVAIFGERTASLARVQLSRREAIEVEVAIGMRGSHTESGHIVEGSVHPVSGGPTEKLRERVVAVDRLTKVVRGGRQLSFAVLTVVGDGDGRIGMGKAKGKEVPVAVQKAMESARRNMIKVQLRNGTIQHDVHGEHGTARVQIAPAKAGDGIISGGPMRAVFEVMGVTDVIGKSLGAANPYNLLRATLDALRTTPTPDELARLRRVSTRR